MHFNLPEGITPGGRVTDYWRSQINDFKVPVVVTP